MSDLVDEHLDRAFASLDEVPVRELVATSEALERRKDGLRNFVSIFRQVAQAREGGWGTDLPRFHLRRTSLVRTKSSPTGWRMRRHRSGGMCARRWPTGIRNSPPPWSHRPVLI